MDVAMICETGHPHYQPFSTLFFSFNKAVIKDQSLQKQGGLNLNDFVQ
jgi:hypothetical protein